MSEIRDCQCWAGGSNTIIHVIPVVSLSIPCRSVSATDPFRVLESASRRRTKLRQVPGNGLGTSQTNAGTSNNPPETEAPNTHKRGCRNRNSVTTTTTNNRSSYRSQISAPITFRKVFTVALSRHACHVIVKGNEIQESRAAAPTCFHLVVGLVPPYSHLRVLYGGMKSVRIDA